LTEALYDNGPAENNGLPQPVSATGKTRDPQPKRPSWLRVGSDVDVAGYIKEELTREYGLVPSCEGEFWRYANTHWEKIPHDELRCRVHAYDGIPTGPSGRPLQLGKSRINSILNELGAMLSEPGFFDTLPAGINCVTGFISFDEDKPHLLPYAPEHRQRHIIAGRWEPGSPAEIPDGSLLAQLLRGSFEGDVDAVDKVDLLGEIAGAAALGYGPKLTAPKGVVLLGRTAENGKSQILDLLRGLLPPGAVSSVPPSRFGDDHHVVKLVGKLLNTSDELA